jgi:hypothetical protein
MATPKQNNQWYVPLLWAVFGLVVAILLLVFFTQPTFFGLEITDSSRSAVGVFLGIGIAIALLLVFYKKVLKPAWQPESYQKQLVKMTKEHAKYNTQSPFDIIGDALFGPADAQITAAGSQTLIRLKDSGIYNGRIREMVWDDRYEAFRHDVTNAFEQVGEGKTQKRTADLEQILTGKMPEVSAKPTIIERQTSGEPQKEKTVLGEGEGEAE